MIASMTGFASVTRDAAGAAVSVTARSVNHRYLDLQVQAPSALLRLEPAIRAQAQRRLARGRVEIRIAVRRTTPPPVEVAVDDALIAALVAAAERPDVARATTGRWTVGELLGFPRVVTVAEREAAPPAADAGLEAVVTAAVDETLDRLAAMRREEGRLLRTELDARLAALADLVAQIEARAAEAAGELGERLAARIAALGPEAAADEEAVAREVVRFVARSDIEEELARLRAHDAHWRTLADGPEPCGRQLDFLLQEMNREINTLGAKADGAGTPGLVVTAKAELERLREQTQNVE